MVYDFKGMRHQARQRNRDRKAEAFQVYPGRIYVVADGSCANSDGIGGWGAVLHFNGHRRYACGGGPEQTNNTMELTGILRGLQMLKERTRYPVIVVSDSKYALSAIFEYSAAWRRNGWVTSSGQPVKNRDLIEALLAERERIAQCRGQWVPGHEGVELNEVADKLAGHARLRFRTAYGELEHDTLKDDLSWSQGWVKA